MAPSVFKKIMSSPVRLAAVAVVVTLLAAGSIAYFLGYLNPVRPGESAPQAMKQPEQGKGKVLYWRSQMDPSEVHDKAGKDRMGMDLIPVYEGEGAAGPPGTVKIDPATIQNIGVKTTAVKRKQLSVEIRTVGRVAYNEKKIRQISLKVGGWVERQNVNFVGQEVGKGERLLEIYSPDLVSTQEEYLLALRYTDRMKGSSDRKLAEGAESLLKSSETRLRYWDITDAQIKALRERGAITRTMVLHAPFRGIITERNVLEGGYAQPGQGIYGIADLSTVWVYADIYEYEVPWLKPDQKAEMTLSYEPGVTYHGRILYIYPYLKNMTRTLQVRMEFPNSKDFKLKPDMWANVTLRSTVSREGLAVPIQAVIQTGKRDVALVALEGGRFEPRELRLGPQTGDEFQVLGGLKEGEMVVTSAQFLINSESNLQAAVNKMLAPRSEEGQAGKAVPPPSMPSMKTPEADQGGQGHAGHTPPSSSKPPMKMPDNASHNNSSSMR